MSLLFLFELDCQHRCFFVGMMLGLLCWICGLVLVRGRECVCRSKSFSASVNSEKVLHDPSKDAHSTKKVTGDPIISVGLGKYVEVVNSFYFEVDLGMTGSVQGPTTNGICPPNQIGNGVGICFWNFDNYPDGLKSGEKWSIELKSKKEYFFFWEYLGR